MKTPARHGPECSEPEFQVSTCSPEAKAVSYRSATTLQPSVLTRCAVSS